MLEPKFVSKPAFTVVGMLLRATPMTPEIPQLWDRFVPRMGEIRHLAEPNASYGLIDNYDEQTNQFDYMAGCAVVEVEALPAGMTRWDVPAATYAVFATTLPALGQTMNAIYNTWFPASGYHQAAGPYFEYYDEEFSPESPTLSIYIPVVKST